MEDILKKTAAEFDKKFVTRVEETGEPLDYHGIQSLPRLLTFIRSAQITAMLAVLDEIIEAGAHPGDEVLCLPTALARRLTLHALRESDNK